VSPLNKKRELFFYEPKQEDW